MRLHVPAALLLSLLAFWAGCTRAYYEASADKEVYQAIVEKTPDVPNMEMDFTIEPQGLSGFEGLDVNQTAKDFLGEAGLAEIGAPILPLEKALEIAVQNSRTYQNRKESLYLQGLQLTLERHQFTPIFSGGGQFRYDHTTRDVVNEIDQMTGTPASLLSQHQTLAQQALIASVNPTGVDVVDENRISGSGNLGVNILLRSGARIAADLTTDFTRFVTGDPNLVRSSAVAATLTQPLLRGAGYKVTMESLTQAERNLLYALREFTRFRKEFVVDVASAYYNVLRNRDTVRNDYLGYQNSKMDAERIRAFVEVGQRPMSDLGQLRQQELNFQTALVDSRSRYEQALDNFKILLGLPVDTQIILDEDELAEMKIIHPDIPVHDAIAVALATRLDLQVSRDEFDDAERKIEVAANALKMDLNLFAATRVSTDPNNSYYDLDFRRTSFAAGVDVDLPLDRKQERNQFRATLIARERALRNVQLTEDQIRLEIEDGWRNLDQAKRTYEISNIQVELSEQRVEEEQLKTELGRGIASELVDARTDLINSQNRRTAALIGHTIARLQFWRDMGILFVKENGQWEEVNDEQS